MNPKQKNILIIISSVLVSFLFVVLITYSATTISTSITTGGSLTVSGNSTLGGDLTVDTSTLYVDSTNNRVGIGTTTPAEALDVNGRIMLEQTSAPASTADRLYNVSGSLFWNGTDLLSGSSKWTSGTANDIYRLNGNIGIGTTTPNWNFQIASSTKTFLTLSDMSAGLDSKHWFLSSQGGSFRVGTSTDALNASTTYLTLKMLTNMGGAGLGINNTSPTDIIHAKGSSPALRLQSNTGTTSEAWLQVLGTTTGTVRLILDDQTSGGKRYDIGSGVEEGLAAGSFYITQKTDGLMRLVILNPSGNVGIGTSTPNWRFQIADTRPFLTLSDTGAGTDSKHWFLSSQGGNFYIGTSTDALNATSTYLTITSSGKVGIGTTIPAATLDINGYLKILQTSTTTECSATIAGSIFFNQANSHLWGCDGTNWLRLDN